MRLVVVLAGLLGCADSEDSAGTADCGLTASTSIVDGETGVPGNASFRVTLSAADDGATLTASEPGAVSADGLTLTWTPSPPVGPLTDVTVTLTTCAGESTLRYTTADLGGPLDADTDLTQTGFRFDLSSGTVVQPPTGGALLATLGADGIELMLGLTPVGVDGMDYRVGVGADGVQDLCSRTLDVAGGTLDGGWFGFGPAGATFQVYDTDVVLESLAFGGAVAPDGSRIDAGWLRTFVGVDALAATYADGDAAEACAFFGNLGAPCEPCPSGAGDCLALEVVDLSGPATGVPVEPVTAACEE